MVPRESVITPNQQLTPRERLVLHTIPHGWHIDKLSFVASWRKSDTTGTGWIGGSQAQARRTGLGRSIALNNGTGENDTQEVEHLGVQRGRTRANELDFSSKQLSDLRYPTLVPSAEDREVSYLLKDETVPERMGINPGCFELLELGMDCPPDQGSFETGGIGSGHDVLVDPIQ